MNKYLGFERLFPRLGGWYLTATIAAVQLVAFLGALPGYLSIRLNTASSNSGLAFAVMSTFAIVGFVSLLLLSIRITPVARKRLTDIASGITSTTSEEELSAWREITSLTWRYGFSAVTIGLIAIVFPSTLVSIWLNGSLSFTPTSLTSSTPIYFLMGGIALVLGYSILALFLIGRFTLRLRLLLTPKDFDIQIKGRAGVLVVSKFLILIGALIVISLLLMVPVGYQQASQMFFSRNAPMEIFSNFQTHSIYFSALILILGIWYSYFASRSVSDPVRDLMETFETIERGDLSARAPISATDELGIVTMQFNRMVARLEMLQNSLEQQVIERTHQLSATNEVGRVASSSLDPEEMLKRVANLFTDQFGYYFAGIYLLDASEKWADLHQATGEAGKLLLLNRHRLEVAGKSLVGDSIRDRQPRFTHQAFDGGIHVRNPVLPYSKSEIALPLIVGDRVLGALEVHSRKDADFGADVINNLQNMAGQVAIALENARLFQEAQENIRELRAIQQQYLFTGWSGISSQPEELEYGVGDESDEGARQVEIPISLRDQILGQIRLENPEVWTAEEENLVNAVATQAAVALENARLVSESRQIALRERMLAEINSKIWSSATIDSVLQTVVKELGRRLDASRATIELNVGEIK